MIFVKRFWHYIILVFILLLFTANAIEFMSRDKSPQVLESINHLKLTLDCYNSISKKSDWNYLTNTYPTLVYLVTGLFFRIFGVSITTAVWSIYPFSVIFLVSVFFIGMHFGEKSGAVASLSIAAANIFFLNYSYIYALDIPQAAMLSLSFLFLLKSENLKNKLFSYLFAMTMGLSIMCRFDAIFYLAGLFIALFIYFAFRSFRIFILSAAMTLPVMGLVTYFLGFSLKNRNDFEVLKGMVWHNMLVLLCFVLVAIFTIFMIEKKYISAFSDGEKEYVKRILTGARVIVISLIISLPFYIYNMHYLMQKLTIHLGDLHVSHNYHENYQIIYSFFPLIFLLVFIGIVYIFIRKKQVFDFILLISMGLSGFLLVTHFGGPFPRFLFTEITVMAVLGGYWMEYTGYLKYPLQTFVFGYAIISLGSLFVSPGVPLLYQEIEAGIRYEPLFYLQSDFHVSPDPDRYRVYQIGTDLKKQFRNGNGQKHPSLYFYYTDKFLDIRQPMYKDLPGHMFDVYSMNIVRVLEYEGIPVLHYRSGNNNPDAFLRENRENPVFLLVGYEDRRVVDDLMNQMENHHPDTKFVGRYGIMGKKKISVYIVY